MMLTMMASISEGHTDLADLLFLVAFILAAIAFVFEVIGEKVVYRTTVFAAVALVCLAWFVL